MKIVMLTNNYLPHVSGVATSIRRLTRSLESFGHEVHLIAPYPADIYDNPHIHRIPSLPLREPLIPLPIPSQLTCSKIINKIRPDIIHTHHPFLLGKTALKIAKKTRTPLVFTHHSLYEQYVHYIPFIPGIKGTTIKRVMKFSNQVNALVAPSESVAQILKQRGLTSRIEVIPTGIEPDFFVVSEKARLETRTDWKVSQNEIVIFSFARLAKEKNFELLIESFSLLVDRIQRPIRLIIGGDGPQQKYLFDLVGRLGLGDKVTFMGGIPHERVPAVLNGADIFAYTSTTETQGLVTLEALASGLPAVVVDGPGNRDIVQNEKNGFITNNTRESIAGALENLIKNDSLRKEFSENGRKRAEDFSVEAVGQKMVKLYTSLLE